MLPRPRLAERAPPRSLCGFSAPRISTTGLLTMRVFDAARTAELLPWGAVVDALAAGFRDGCEMPVRHHHGVQAPPGDPEATLLLMPAWTVGGYLGVKVATVFPGNASRGLGAVQASYILASAETGEPLALIDGLELTLRRTAAASALAARFLARADARRLLVVGTGNLAPHLAGAHAAVRPRLEVEFWGRRPERARLAARSPLIEGLAASTATDLEAAVRGSDIVSTATLADEPLVLGDWLRAGTHVDLVGGFTPTMREADDEAVRRATVFVDTRDGALSEAGDLVQPIASGALKAEEVAADLYELCRGRHDGRRDASEITLFKSVGAALEDLFAAILLWERS